MDKSLLAKLMLNWEHQQLLADQLKDQIEQEILGLQATVVTGNVRAKYNSPRKAYQYRQAAEQAPTEGKGADLLIEYTTTETITTTTTDWRRLVLDGLGIKQADVPYTEGKPSVSIKIEGGS